jgi:mono/diheme cytochrome c family protein
MADLLPRATGLGLVLMGLAPASAFALPWDIDMVDSYFYRAYEWSMQEIPDGTVARNPAGIRVAGNSYGNNNAVADGLFLDDIDKSICSPDHPNYGQLKMPEGILQDQYLVDQGAELFSIYCAACHGVEGRLGSPVMAMENGVMVNEGRFMTAAVPLSGGCEAKSDYDYSDYGDDADQFCEGFTDPVSCEAHCTWTGDATNPVDGLCYAGLYTTIRNGNGTRKMPGAMRGYHQAMGTDEIWSVVNYVKNLPGNDPEAGRAPVDQ